MRDDSNEKPCISFLAREVQPAAKPTQSSSGGGYGARPFSPVRTAATEVWTTRPWPFIPRAESHPATKPAKARVEEEKGVRPFGPVSTAATERWRTRPWPFTPPAEQAISFGGLVAEETFGMANNEEPVEKALMASSSVAVTFEDSASSNLAPLKALAEFLPGKVREPLPARGGINAFVRGGINAEWSESVARNRAAFTGPRAGYSKNGGHYTQQQYLSTTIHNSRYYYFSVLFLLRWYGS